MLNASYENSPSILENSNFLGALDTGISKVVPAALTTAWIPFNEFSSKTTLLELIIFNLSFTICFLTSVFNSKFTGTRL